MTRTPSPIPRGTTAGVPDAEVSLHPFATADGLSLLLTRFRRGRAERDDVVLLVHGLTSSSDIYVMPEHRNLTGYLLDHGFGEVWTLDSRMSNRFPYNTEPGRQTLDDLARFDYPAALAELRGHIGDRPLHVFAHCLGSMSFAMGLFGGAFGGITSVVANSVSLVVRVPSWSRWKIRFGPGLAEHLGIPALDPRGWRGTRYTPGRALSRLVTAAHPECDNRACHLISFSWGAGWPALYSHEQLDPVTHERIADLLGPVGLGYHRHVRRIVDAGHAVRADPADPRHQGLPTDYLREALPVPTPHLYLTGDRNNVFRDSNILCHREFSRRDPGRHELAVAPGYGHLDTIIGRNAHLDVFPTVVDFFKRQAG
jgi:hypothetical protein